MSPCSDVTALRALFIEFLTDTNSVQRIAELLAGSNLRYDMGSACATATPTGWFAPSNELELLDGSTVRLPELLRTGRPTLIDIGGGLRDSVSPWLDRVDHVQTTKGDRRLSMLIRPDGYVAWSAEDQAPLDGALRRWFGAPSAA